MFSRRSVWSALVAVVGVLVSVKPASAQDAFDSTANTGYQTQNTGNFTGAQTQQGGYAQAPVIQGVNTWGRVFYRPQVFYNGMPDDAFVEAPIAQPPMLQGWTNGTIGPQGGNATVIQGIEPQESKYSAQRLDLTACEVPSDEAIAPPNFPPLPKRVVFPDRLSVMRYEDVEVDPSEKARHERVAYEAKKYGMWHAAEKRYDLAMVAYREAIAEDPEDTEAQNLLNQQMLKCGLKANDWKSRVALARKAEQKGDYQAAFADWLECTKISNDGFSMFNLACSYKRLQKNHEFLQHCILALRLKWDPSNTAAQAECHRIVGQYMLIQAELASNDTELHLVRIRNASVEFRRAVTLDPMNKKALEGLLTVAKDAVALNPCFDNYLMLSGAYILSGDQAHAQQAYDDCHDCNSQDPRLEKMKIAIMAKTATWSTLARNGD